MNIHIQAVKSLLKVCVVGNKQFNCDLYYPTGPEAHPSSCTICTGSFLGVKSPERRANHPPFSSEVENGLELDFCASIGVSRDDCHPNQ
jgi:hypothetical protein